MQPDETTWHGSLVLDAAFLASIATVKAIKCACNDSKIDSFVCCIEANARVVPSSPPCLSLQRRPLTSRARVSDVLTHSQLLAPRTGYLPLCAEKIRRHFNLASVGGADDNREGGAGGEMWFEHRGRPLRWNHPIGVLYDCLVGGGKLPWEVVVHIKNYPDALMRSGGNAVETHFINQIKQACQIKVC